MRRVSKKADLSLSTNAIVVMIIAIVILGLALTFSRGVFTKIGEALSGIGGQTISNPATYDDPMTLSTGNLEIVRGKTMPISISVFNKFETGSCIWTGEESCRIPITVVMPECIGFDEGGYPVNYAPGVSGLYNVLNDGGMDVTLSSVQDHTADYTRVLQMLPVAKKQVAFSEQETFSTKVQVSMGMPAGDYSCVLMAVFKDEMDNTYKLLVQEDLMITVR